MLEKLVQIYNALPPPTKSEIVTLVAEGDFAWKPLLQLPWPLFHKPELEHSKDVIPNIDIKLVSDTLVQVPFGVNYELITRKMIESDERPIIYLVSSSQKVLHYWREGWVRGVFSSKQLFNEDKYYAFLKKDQKTLDEIRFLLKIVVWLGTNWQTETIIDLNLSFFGGQFRSLVSGKDLEEHLGVRVLCCDYETFFALSEKGLYHDFLPVVASLNAFEKAVTRSTGIRFSWGGVLYALKAIYNPETDFGNVSLSELVLTCLAGTDLFFGWLLLELRKRYPSAVYITWENLVQDDLFFHKVQIAAANLQKKLLPLIEYFEQLRDITLDIASFFSNAENQVRWLEPKDENCIFSINPYNSHSFTTQTQPTHKEISNI